MTGYRIGPFEVESALLQHPAVAEAAVVGEPDELRGEVVVAHVVPQPGTDAGDALVAGEVDASRPHLPLRASVAADAIICSGRDGRRRGSTPAARRSNERKSR
jgi:acyl-coenzyme A synthetase/AMP-(fatty) acid ligase